MRINKLGKVTKPLLLISVCLLILLAVYLLYMTHGFLWSIDVPIYTKLLRSVPSPSGLLPDTDRIDFGPEDPCGRRIYEVADGHAESVDFFLGELPRSGWDLEEHCSWDIELNPGRLKSDELLFTDHRKYWLVVAVDTEVDIGGVAVIPSRVRLSVCTEQELRNIYRRYRSSSACEAK